MNTKTELPIFTLLLMISFASVNAVLFTPGLPEIAKFFAVASETAQQTITWFLVGYAGGQLVYGPLANRFGRKPALYMGIGLQIVSSFLCILAGVLQEYTFLIFGRFLLGLGSGVGLKMTFTLVNECYEPKKVSQTISFLALAFSITPGVGVALGGFLNAHYGWMSTFYAGAVYGLVLLLLVMRLPETLKVVDLDALNLKKLFDGYSAQIKNFRLMAGGLLMGNSTSFVYIFAATAPFIAMNSFGMGSAEYGMANLWPPVGFMLGSLCSARLVAKYPLTTIMRTGIAITSTGTLFMIAAMFLNLSVLVSLFLPMFVMYFGNALIFSNASAVAMSQVSDKAYGSAVMSFLNMGLATFMVLNLGFFSVSMLLLPMFFISLCVVMMTLYKVLMQ